jgi:IS30 family transposase
MEKKTYGQLGLTERIEIYRLHADGKSLQFIARALQRSVSTVSRELKRNSKVSKKWTGGYDPQRAQELMLRRHARGRAHKLERDPALRKKVFDRLAQGWSPEQIAGRLGKGPAAARISYESIYRYIYWRSWSFKETLHRLLPRHKHRRGRRLKNGRWSKTTILDRVSIHDRPAVVEGRTQRMVVERIRVFIVRKFQCGIVWRGERRLAGMLRETLAEGLVVPVAWVVDREACMRSSPHRCT